MDPPVGTRLESDPLYISSPVPLERGGRNRGERGGGSSRERIVERGHRVRRDDPLSSLRLLNRIVNTHRCYNVARCSLLPATCATRASLCPASFTRSFSPPPLSRFSRMERWIDKRRINRLMIPNKVTYIYMCICVYVLLLLLLCCSVERFLFP